YDVITGIHLGAHKAEWKDGGFEKIIGRDYFDASDAPLSTLLTKNNGSFNILGVRNTRLVKAHGVFWQYGADSPSTWDAIFSYRQGATLNIKRLGNIFSPSEVNNCGPNDICNLGYTFKDSFCYNNNAVRHMYNTGTTDYVDSFQSHPCELTITKGSFKTSISLGTAAEGYQGYFMEASYQVVLITGRFLQIWRLPSKASPLYELVHVEAFVESCKHGRRFRVVLKPIKWISPNGNEFKDDLNSKYPVLTFPRSAGDTFTTTEKYRYENGIVSLLGTYAKSDPGIKHAIIRFLADHIHPSSKYDSSLVILCRAWKNDDRAIFEEVFARLLPIKNRITWIPDRNATKREDPLSILLKSAWRTPSVLTACKIVMDYCVNHAIESKNLFFLSPFLRNLQDVEALFPFDAHMCLRGMANLTVSDRLRDRIVENDIVSHPRHRIVLWETFSGSNGRIQQLHVRKERSRDDAGWREYIIEKVIAFSLWQAKHFRMTTLSLNSIRDLTQIHGSAGRLHRKAATFDRDIYKTSFDALWHYKDITEFQKKGPAAATGQGAVVMQRVKSTQITTWWKVLFYMFWLKLRLNPHSYVTCHAFPLEFFDNPAIAALVDYKWNTIGYKYWAVRFASQCMYYLLVVSAALLQIYHKNVGRTQMAGVFIAILPVGVIYLWLELLQAIKDFKKYIRCLDNALDIVTYTLPMMASVSSLMALRNNNPVANTSLLSYSVLIVLLHMLLELRIYKSVCQYETFIRQSMVEMRGGRFDPVAEELKKESWTFHLLMMVYFFFTVIIMLNVLIALINVAFEKRDDGLRLVQARLHYIEFAENASYHIPGFRETYDCFPKEIYFCATDQEIARAREAETKELEADRKVAEVERKVLEAEKRASETERRAAEAEKRASEAEKRASKAEKTASFKSDPAIVELMEQVQKLSSQLISQQKQRSDF
ncbi:hypothetical protein BGZ70_010304, partial [Mortierella alpina]